MIANDHLLKNIGGHSLFTAYLMGLISVKQFYFIPIILMLEKHVQVLEKSLNFWFGNHYKPWSATWCGAQALHSLATPLPADPLSFRTFLYVVHVLSFCKNFSVQIRHCVYTCTAIRMDV